MRLLKYEEELFQIIWEILRPQTSKKDYVLVTNESSMMISKTNNTYMENSIKDQMLGVEKIFGASCLSENNLHKSAIKYSCNP